MEAEEKGCHLAVQVERLTIDMKGLVALCNSLQARRPPMAFLEALLDLFSTCTRSATTARCGQEHANREPRTQT